MFNLYHLVCWNKPKYGYFNTPNKPSLSSVASVFQLIVMVQSSVVLFEGHFKFLNFWQLYNSQSINQVVQKWGHFLSKKKSLLF